MISAGTDFALRQRPVSWSSCLKVGTIETSATPRFRASSAYCSARCRVSNGADSGSTGIVTPPPHHLLAQGSRPFDEAALSRPVEHLLDPALRVGLRAAPVHGEAHAVVGEGCFHAASSIGSIQ